MVFLVVMYGCQIWNHKEIWALKDWCFWTVVLENTLECPLDFEEIKPVNPKGNQPGYSLEGLMLKLKLQHFGRLMRRTDSLEKTLMLGKIEGRRRGREYKMVGWHHWLVGHEFEQAPEVGDGQGTLVCCSCSPWGCKELDMTGWLNWTDKSNKKVCSLHQDMYIISLAALFIDGPICKNPNSLNNEMNKLWHNHMMECCSAIQINE